MLGVLQRYVLREVLVPSLMALATLAFVLLVQMLFTQPDEMAVVVSVPILLTVTFYSLPSLLTLAIPMAILTGVLLGIGRMTVDSEIKACRTHGVNLFKVFFPVLICGAAASVLVLLNSLYFAPWMLSQSYNLLDRLKVEVIGSIRPGMFEQVSMGKDTEIVLNFKDRNPETGELDNVKMWMEGAPGVLKDQAKTRKRPPKALESLKSAGLSSDELLESLPELKPSSDSLPAKVLTSATLSQGKRGGPDATTAATEESVPSKTRFMAESGRIEIDTHSAQPKATLSLRNGSIHVLRGEMDPRYTVVEFKQMRHEFKPRSDSNSEETIAPAKSLGELRSAIAQNEALHAKRVLAGTDDNGITKNIKIARVLRAEILQRVSVSLACFAFALIGLPLAIYIRPSGKSIGISIAFLLILAYYGVWHYGWQLTRGGLWFGPAVVFLPNLLLTIIGAVMLHRTVHR